MGNKLFFRPKNYFFAQKLAYFFFVSIFSYVYFQLNILEHIRVRLWFAEDEKGERRL